MNLTIEISCSYHSHSTEILCYLNYPLQASFCYCFHLVPPHAECPIQTRAQKAFCYLEHYVQPDSIVAQ